MNLYELAAHVIEALEAENIPYMVVGALSSSVFGIPRATKDVDIVLQLQTWITSHAGVNAIRRPGVCR
jgi:hypothetical protein